MPRPPKLGLGMVEVIRKMYQDGASVEACAVQANVSHVTARKELKDLILARKKAKREQRAKDAYRLYSEGKTINEIAQALNIASGSVRSFIELGGPHDPQCPISLKISEVCNCPMACLTRKYNKDFPQKLQPDQVKAIRQQHAAGMTQVRLAQHYGVTQGLISQIVRGVVYRHIGGPIKEAHQRPSEAFEAPQQPNDSPIDDLLA